MAKFFDFAAIFDRIVRKSGVHEVNDYADTQFSKISNYIFVSFFVSILRFPKKNSFPVSA